ncbi:MAE_28990/MAE_18760 family HEPN-like nuclease [Acinetobacter sp. 809848]|uniref:MAE_28990/MAE_18760 family HEPN-like nuclease n=1 Tax=Acinetobacter sp. 809848 TaxID=1310637 RepID=UPI00044A04FF|nr:MAE_28990/MAE_18760 family HEPN-like nuclease [Acinetobacter sp. 809848]EXC27089.1 hypothetical protein J536_2497 [Acinetobacter sp. 809848]
MKIEVLESTLDDELSWRKKEITSLNLIAFKIHQDSDKDQVLYQTVMKTLFLLLYSHWEGFVKKTSKLYLKYLSNQALITSNLTPNFAALMLQKSIDTCSSEQSSKSLSITHYLDFIDKHEKRVSNKFKVEVNLDQDVDDGFIQTYSNLNYKNYKNIINSLNLPFYEYYFSAKTKVDIQDTNNKIQKVEYLKKLLDFSLLAHRNAIAHGSKNNISLDFNEYSQLENKILFLLGMHKEDILEFCFNKYFLRENSAQLSLYLEEQSIKVESFFTNLEKSLEEKHSLEEA